MGDQLVSILDFIIQTLHTKLPSLNQRLKTRDIRNDLLSNNETLNNRPSTSFVKYITRAEATFNTTGGELCAARSDSDVKIIVPSGAIPAGTNQAIFFGVINNETQLLRDLPETPDRTLISPVIECGPHDINLVKPVEIIVPHDLYLREAKKESITVYRSGQLSGDENGRITWEKVPNESEVGSRSKAWFTVKENSIHIETKTFSIWSIFACGGKMKRKRATVFASRPDPKSDLIYLRFYVYSDNEDSKRRVEMRDRERFPDSRLTREESFKMCKDKKNIIVKLADLEEGWKLDKTSDIQIYNYQIAYGNGFRSINACDFAVKPEDGRNVNGFSGFVNFQQEGQAEEYSIYLNPGFTPLKRQSIRQRSTASGQVDASATIVRGSTSAAEEIASQGRCHYSSSLGSDDEPITQDHCLCIREHVGVRWKDLLRNLSMDEMKIRNLEEDHKDLEVADKCFQGLLKWKNFLGPQRATTKKLCNALRVVGCPEALTALSRELQNTSSYSNC